MKRKLFTLLFLLSAAATVLAQDKMEVKDANGNLLMQVNDEGAAGSITLPGLSAAPSPFTNKIYNIGGELYFNGIKIGSLWSLNGANIFYNTGNVGIGLNNPSTALHVSGTITATAFVGDGSGLTGISGDNLGNHTATQVLNLAGNNITNGGTITATTFIGDGSGLTNLPPGNGWGLTGNAGTVDGTNFIGTSDDVPLDFRVNNVRALRLEYTELGPDQISSNLIGGGDQNSISGYGGVIAGGGDVAFGFNNITANYGTISGGANNTVNGDASTVSGGTNNLASGSTGLATVSGGENNSATGDNSTVPGGQNNLAAGDFSFAAGRRAKITSDHDGSFLFSDGVNADFNSASANEFAVRATGGVRFVTALDNINAPSQTVSIGASNGANIIATNDLVPLDFRINNHRALRLEDPEGDDQPNIIAGFSGNSVSAGVKGATIVGGGLSGRPNEVTANYGTTVGGRSIAAEGEVAIVVGGENNFASGFRALVAGGLDNRASGSHSVVLGGSQNDAAGERATVIGGSSNSAGGAYSFAAGNRASIGGNHGGSFLFADLTNASFNSAAANEFAVRATGGFRFVTAVTAFGIPTQTVSIDNSGTVTATAFVGDGSGLTGITATGDNLGNHTATQALNLAGNNITNGGTVTASAFVGDGSGLTGISGADNLGNHTATQALNLAGNNITNGGTITASTFVGDGSGLTGIAGDNLGNHTATQALNLNGNNITNGGTVTASAFIGDGSGLIGIAGDNLGSHTATQNVKLDGNYLSGDGDSEGIFVDSNGNVGIDATAPSVRLEVNGTVKANAIAFSDGSSLSTANGIYTVGIGDFVASEQPVAQSLSTGLLNNGLGGSYINSTSNNSVDIMAPVHLPQGATVTKVTFYGYDLISTTNIAMTLERRQIQASSFNVMANHTSNTGAGAYSGTDQTISNATIDNSQYLYYVRVGMVGGTWHSAGLLAVNAVVIEWEMQ